MKRFLLAALLTAFLLRGATPEYSIRAIRYATSPGVQVSELVVDGPKDKKVDIAMVIWLIQGGGHTILFDSGFYRDTFLKDFPMRDYLRPDEAVKLAGVQPQDVTDIVISHAHWDHMGGIDLFAKAKIWIQKEEYRYYAMQAWQPGGDHGGIDPQDVKQLVQLNTQGRLHLVDGDDVELFPGIRAYTGSRHLCLTISSNSWRSTVRAGFGQLLFLSQSVVSPGQRHIQRCRSCGKYCRAGAND